MTRRIVTAARMSRTLAIVSICYILFDHPDTLTAGGPETINHQGVVAVNGVKFAGPTGFFRFALVADQGNGATLWTSSPDTSPADGIPDSSVSTEVLYGIFSVNLGEGSMPPIPAQVFSDPNAVLRVWFDDGSNGLQQLAPDQTLTGMPYAANSTNSLNSQSSATGSIPTTFRCWISFDFN